MILITGGTGFIGKALIRQLNEMGELPRVLIRPSRESPDLLKGLPTEVALSSLSDPRGLRAAMVGVDTVYHLASGERQGTRANLHQIDILGTQAVVSTARDAGVKRLFYLSHLGADRGSAYPMLKAKGIAEEFVRRSGIDFTIIRSAVVFGPGDRLTTGLASILRTLPSIFLVPGDGKSLLQPLWVEDLATCLAWALEDKETRNRMVEIGGPEYLTFTQVVEQVMAATGKRRRLVNVRLPYLRWLTEFLESMSTRLPTSVYWLDYLASNRTCSLDTAPRVFNLMPSRFSQRLAYLKGDSWRTSPQQTMMQRG